MPCVGKRHATLPAPQTVADALLPRLDASSAGDDDPSQRLAEALDRSLNYALSRVTLGLSPAAVAEAYFDWLVHLAAAPGKQLQLWQKALRKGMRFWHYVATCALAPAYGADLHRAPASRQAVPRGSVEGMAL